MQTEAPMHLKHRHLEVFDALMQAGSVSLAAERLNVTQPAVSVALANLERELGFRLFHRARGYFAPTAEAQLLHSEAERGLLAFSRIAERAAELRTGASGSVSVASNGALAINLLPPIVAAFQAETPGVRVDLSVRGSRRIAGLVSARLVDIGLIDAPVPVAGLAAEIRRLPCVLICREEDPLARRAEVTPADLIGRPVIAITGDHPIDRRLDALVAEAGGTVERRTTCGFFAIARNLVAAGAGVALVDRGNGRLARDDGVVWRPFVPAIVFELALVTAEGHPLGRGAERFRARLSASLPSL